MVAHERKTLRGRKRDSETDYVNLCVFYVIFVIYLDRVVTSKSFDQSSMEGW